MGAPPKLIIAESFYSLQGEGPTIGVPSIFLRLAGCNLLCYFRNRAGQGTPCDTIPVWQRGSPLAPEDVLADWESRGWLRALRRGAHLVITGGEPTLQQPALEAFLYILTSHIGKPYIELETNGTMLLRDRFLSFLSQVNCSPKLSNSSMPREQRYRLEVLRQFRELDPLGPCQAFLKFVITCLEDMAEVMQDFVEPLDWPSARVCLMPEGMTREDLAQKRIWLAEVCKEYGFRYSDRLQIMIWDKVTGV